MGSEFRQRSPVIKISTPFVVALIGLAFFIAVLAIGEFLHIKGAVPIAFLVGGTMMIGGIGIGLLRGLFTRGDGP